jgi:aldose 1-epimerase
MLPTGELVKLESADLEYKNGIKCPAVQELPNDMYSVDSYINSIMITDIPTGKGIFYTPSNEHKFWIFWNDGGGKGFFCPEPMTAMINAPNLDLPRLLTGYTEVPPKGKYTPGLVVSVLRTNF